MYIPGRAGFHFADRPRHGGRRRGETGVTLHFNPTAIPPAVPAVVPVRLTDHSPTASDFATEVLAGLARPQKTVSCKFFYDDHGSDLFDQICDLPEYYPTRTELTIMHRFGGQIADAIGSGATVIEYGSGSSNKTGALLDYLEGVKRYLPIDISRGHLMQSSRTIARRYPGLAVTPVCADYTTTFAMPAGTPKSNRLAYFPGSTIGNFEPDAAVGFLKSMRSTCGPDSRLLIGVDLKKDPSRLHAAYNDAPGITARFNLNLLRRINNELDGTFDLSAFAHYAPYLPALGRMEMHLISLRDQTAAVAGRTFRFGLGETIKTECCCKYTPAEFAKLAKRAGYVRERIWVDDGQLFSVQLFRAE
jgi:dimethylhistidine N-methyltransferase